MASVSLEHATERSSLPVCHVESVPEEREPPAGAQHAVDLAQSVVAAEPVKRFGDDDEIGGGVREGDLFRGAVDDVGGDVAGKLSTHLRHGLDCDDVRAARREQPRQLSGSRSEIDDRGTRIDRRSLDEPRNGLGGVPRATTFVRLGTMSETGAREPMNAHAHHLQAMDGVRIDKSLWAARFVKTRGAAAEAALGGRVHLNGMRVKPSKEVHVGDTIEVTIHALRRTVHVSGVSDRRGSASVASTLYEETPESLHAREQNALERRLARPLGADLGVRPTKQDRRRLDALRRAQRQQRRSG